MQCFSFVHIRVLDQIEEMVILVQFVERSRLGRKWNVVPDVPLQTGAKGGKEWKKEKILIHLLKEQCKPKQGLNCCQASPGESNPLAGQVEWGIIHSRIVSSSPKP